MAATPTADHAADVHLFGIRHHGPGSARSLRRALEGLRPDLLLVEGPPDADSVLPLLAHAEMRPPAAILVYVPGEPRRAVFYPFAAFSPEWQAIHYAIASGVPARFMDLPHWHQLALDDPQTNAPDAGPLPQPDDASGGAAADDEPDLLALLAHPARDPLGWLARAAGYSDGERWWEHMVEQRRDDAGLFTAILEAMAALREEAEALDATAAPPPPHRRHEDRREAWMRQAIRVARREGFRRIAVVCGAWHAPALRDLGDEKRDVALLKGLPKVKTSATWAPWTYGRLSFESGYGAGVTSPGWYDHLWHHPDGGATRWMARVAHLLRAEDLDASAAHVIEAVRLSEALAAMRGHPLPGLPELNDACRAVFCFGGDAPMRLIHERLIVGERLGAVPDETPAVPLQQDLAREQRRLRLPPEAQWKQYDLDLRKPTDLERSHLLRRLNLLGVGWGALQGSSGTGTFRESWRLQWEPEFAVSLIEAAAWGNTVRDAAATRALAVADAADALPPLVAVVNQVLLADLPDSVAALMERLQERSARIGDVGQLMDALVQEDRSTRASLVNSLRYGNVRQTDGVLVSRVVDGLVVRICVGLPGACASLDDDAAAAMFARIVGVDAALRLLQNAEHLAAWHAALRRVADLGGAHGLVAGRCCRILLDAGRLDADEAGRRLGLALSTAADPAQAAAWVEGRLKNSGLILLHDGGLWSILDRWVAGLSPEIFPQLLPLLRRTFATFPVGERRQLGERARVGAPGAGPAPGAGGARGGQPDFDQERADAVLPLVARLLGLKVT